jgi:UDP-4-amino-4,6-dideoxy-N-acetyl-beta-L-altrosamine transaminase
MKPLPYGRPCLDDDDIDAVVAVLRSEWLTTGPMVERFESALADRVGAAHAVVCSSGTAALHLAALALELGPGDSVIVPSMTFAATANAPHMTGAEVVFADVDRETGLLTPETFEAALDAASGSRVRAVFPVHLNGQAAAMAEIAAVARARDIAVVEDACHALGAQYAGDGGAVGCGAHARLAAFSFHPVKTVAMGEGGAVATNEAALAARMRQLRHHGLVRDSADFENRADGFEADGSPRPWYSEMPAPGLNYRASDIHCALGLSQLAKLDRFIEARADLVAAYDEALASLAPRLRPAARMPGGRPAWHLYVIDIDFEAFGASRAAVMRQLSRSGVGTQLHYQPIHRFAYYVKRYGERSLPGAEHYASRALSLPLFVGMTKSDVERVAAALLEALVP